MKRQETLSVVEFLIWTEVISKSSSFKMFGGLLYQLEEHLPDVAGK